jgi:hypothetical protein
MLDQRNRRHVNRNMNEFLTHHLMTLVWLSDPLNAHHHPPEAIIAEAKLFKKGRVNDVVGL